MSGSSIFSGINIGFCVLLVIFIVFVVLHSFSVSFMIFSSFNPSLSSNWLYIRIRLYAPPHISS